MGRVVFRDSFVLTAVIITMGFKMILSGEGFLSTVCRTMNVRIDSLHERVDGGI